MPVALLSGEDVDRLGPALAAEAPAFSWGPPPGSRKKPRPHPALMPPTLACGCIPGHAFCRDGAALSSACRIADYLGRDATSYAASPTSPETNCTDTWKRRRRISSYRYARPSRGRPAWCATDDGRRL
jgi:hypothetical protein